MSIQRNVRQQNSECKYRIREFARRFNDAPSEFSWLNELLLTNGVKPEGGLLVDLTELPDQGGTLYSGKWLTQEEEFWEFAVLLSRTTGELLEVEDFSNVTAAVPMAASQPGKGASFGYLAVQVLGEARGG